MTRLNEPEHSQFGHPYRSLIVANSISLLQAVEIELGITIRLTHEQILSGYKIL